MKISDIAKKYGVSKDTLYFYISKGLLIPRVNGKQYLADDTFERDLQMILKYRDFGFQLTEIHSALSAIRKNPPGEEGAANTMLADILTHRAEEISGEIGSLESKLEDINSAITELRLGEKSANPSRKKIGVPMSMVSLLRCPRCCGTLNFSNSDMSQTQIMRADITCSCGYRAKIRDGILLTPNQEHSQYDQADTDKVIYSNVPDYLTSLYQKSYYWMEKCLRNIINQGAVVMETHLNTYFYLQYEQTLMEQNSCKLILVDKYPEILGMYKAALEASGSDMEVLFIADDGTDIPVCPEVVDVFVDFFGSNEHQFFNDSLLIEKLSEYLASNAYIVGTYFSITGGRQSIKNMKSYYPEASSNNFNLEFFRESVEKAGYIGVMSECIGETSETGDDYRCLGFVDKGEKIRLDSFMFKKGPKIVMDNHDDPGQ